MKLPIVGVSFVMAVALLAPGAAPGQGAAPVGLEVSAGVVFNPHGPDTRAVGLRRLAADETALVQARAQRFYAAMRAAPSWQAPRDRAHLAITTAAIEAPGVLQQDITAYWTVPRDARRRPDGLLTPLLGGAHDLLYFAANRALRGQDLVDPATRGEFTRGDPGRAADPAAMFAAPRELGTVAAGGRTGTVYADVVVFTRDGRGILEPAPIGRLLEIELTRLRTWVRGIEDGAAQRLREAEASMTPERVAERRARRAEAWARETRDPAQMAQRLDAAHRTDLWALERERADFTAPAEPDPANRFWGPRLALQAAERTLAALQAQGPGALAAPGCGRMEPGFQTSLAVRFEPAATAGADCVPMVRLRAGLIDPKRPPAEVQHFTAWFRGSLCGEALAGRVPVPTGGRCGYAVPLLREMDWAAAVAALGW